MPGSGNAVTVIDSLREGCPTIPIVEGRGSARVVVWPGSGAVCRTFHYIDLLQRSSTVRLQHQGEGVYYVVKGEGHVIDVDTGARMALREGAMVHVGAGDAYRFATEEGTLTILGGPCPADASLYERAGAALARGAA